MFPSNLKPSASISAGADGVRHDLTLRLVDQWSNAPADAVGTVGNSCLSGVKPRQGDLPATELPDMELWCNCDD